MPLQPVHQQSQRSSNEKRLTLIRSTSSGGGLISIFVTSWDCWLLGGVINPLLSSHPHFSSPSSLSSLSSTLFPFPESINAFAFECVLCLLLLLLLVLVLVSWDSVDNEPQFSRSVSVFLLCVAVGGRRGESFSISWQRWRLEVVLTEEIN